MRVQWKELLWLFLVAAIGDHRCDAETAQVEFIISKVENAYALSPFLWNVTADPKISIHLNYSTKADEGRILTLVARDPSVTTIATVFTLVARFTHGQLEAIVSDFRDQELDSMIIGTEFSDDLIAFPTSRQYEDIIVLGVLDGDLVLNADYNETDPMATDFGKFELLQLHLSIGTFDAEPALLCSGSIEIFNVEKTDGNLNESLTPSADFDYVQRIASILKTGGFSVAELMQRLRNEDIVMDESEDTLGNLTALSIANIRPALSALLGFRLPFNRTLGGSKQALSCNAQEKSLCENAELCVRPNSSSFFSCVCRDGYGGQYCQFSLFPRTCSEHNRLSPIQQPTVVELDMDGSGPLRATFAECLPDGRTRVLHNMPTGTILRNETDDESKYFPIHYRLFSVPQLKGLKERSIRCEQQVEYECMEAPLDFSSNMTWFEAVENEGIIRQLGSGVGGEFGCGDRERCSCDQRFTANSDPYTVATRDSATFRDSLSAIQMIYVRSDPNNPIPPNGYGRLTLGPLDCWGDRGESRDASVTLRRSDADLRLPMRMEAFRFVEFEFRSAATTIMKLFEIGGDNENGQYVRVDMVNDRQLLLAYSDPLANFTLILHTKESLSDLKWHRVIVELARHELRFGVDSKNLYNSIERHSFAVDSLRIGGFVGCVRAVRVDNEPKWSVDMEKSDGVAVGCPNLCAERSQPCEQGSHCVERFETASTQCLCRSPFGQFAECDWASMNDEGISFHDRAIGFLKFFHTELNANPLNANLSLRIRTDQRRALLLYAHDHLDNFLQIHLANEFEMVLTLNNGSEVMRCAVAAAEGKEFSTMRWIEIGVEQSAERVALHVEGAACELAGAHRLADDRIQLYSGLMDDAILPPQSAAPVLTVQPYHVLFIGGVPRAQRNRRRSSESKASARTRRDADLSDEDSEKPLIRTKRDRPQRNRRLERIAYYVTEIPPLLGCMKGFTLNGALLDLQNGGSRPNDPAAIRSGCVNNCDSLRCENGGHCAVNWMWRPLTDATQPVTLPTASIVSTTESNSVALERRSVEELIGRAAATKPHLSDSASAEQFGQKSKVSTCDCSKTSFGGSHCADGRGVQFSGQSALVFQLRPLRSFIAAAQVDEQSLKFAFTSRMQSLRVKQRLATLFFPSRRQLFVDLCRNGSVHVGIRLPNVSQPLLETFGGNYTDGHRHFVQLLVRGDSGGVLALVDGERRRVASTQMVDLAEVEEFWFGGGHRTAQRTGTATKSDEDEELVVEFRHNFEGCMSGVDITFERTVGRSLLQPLRYYFDDGHIFHKSVRVEPRDALPLAPSRECGRFRIPGWLPTAQHQTQLPVWEAPFFALPFNDSHMILRSPAATLPHQYDWVLLVGLAVVSGGAVLIICCCIWCVFCRVEERSPRFGGSGDGDSADDGRKGKKKGKSPRFAAGPAPGPIIRRSNGNAPVSSDSLVYVDPNAPLLQQRSPPQPTPPRRNIATAQPHNAKAQFFGVPVAPPRTIEPNEEKSETARTGTESLLTANAVDSDDEGLAEYDDRPLSIVSVPSHFSTISTPRSPPTAERSTTVSPLAPTTNTVPRNNTPPSLSTFLNATQLQPEHPLPAGRLSPKLPGLRSSAGTLHRQSPANTAERRPIRVPVPIVDSDPVAQTAAVGS